MMWLAGLILSLLVVVALFLRAAKGPAYSLDTLRMPIRGLLRQGFNGGFLIIDAPSRPKFLQLSKYIRAPGDFGIELAFPKAEWSLTHYEELRAMCEREGIGYRIDGASYNDPLDFLFIDFGRDIERAHEITRRVLVEILGMPLGGTLYCKLENATPEDRLVDDPAEPRPAGS